MRDDFSTIGEALDEISWYWISDNYPQLAEAIQTEVKRGARPEAIRRFVMKRTERLELALRCEQAARWVEKSS